MKGFTKILPVGLIVAIILPGITISILGIHFLSQQRAVRELNLRQERERELQQLGGLLESRVLELVAEAINQFPDTGIELSEKKSLLAALKKLILQNGIVKYPFIINGNKEFIYPIVQRSSRQFLKTVDHAAADPRIKRLYQMASDLELNHNRFLEALHIYQQCLAQNPSTRSMPYLLNAIARCYFKMNKLQQALYYYHLVLEKFKDRLADNDALKFLVLRQLAKCYQLLGIPDQASSIYLNLYEEILRHETLASGEDFLFFKNEALNFLNLNARKSSAEATDSTAAQLPSALQGKSQVDVTLQWLFLEGQPTDLEEENELSNRGHRLLKIEELYTSSDEKTRFYQMIKKLPLHSAREKPQTPIFPISDWDGKRREICFQKIPSSTGNPSEDIYLGFMLTPAFVEKQIYPGLVEQKFKHHPLRLALLGRGAGARISPWPGHTHLLLTHTFDQVLTTQKLSIFANEADFFSHQVKREIWINYGLVATLIATLILSTLLFFRYIRREAEVVRLKSEFIDHASHTLKTPLTRMGLLAETIAQGWIEGKEQKASFAQAIVEETTHINQLVNNLLNFSRMEAGKMEYHFRRSNLQEVVTKFLAQYSASLKRERFQLDVSMEENLPPANIDKDAITLVILNVCQNAMKYSPREKWIGFNLSLQENWLILSISDHGMGIEEKEQQDIFNKFYRSRNPKARVLEGSGLGLFLAQEIVKAHNGKIILQSESGAGSTFSILLPVVEDVEEET